MKKRVVWAGVAVLGAAALVLPMTATGQKNKNTIWPDEMTVRDLERMQEKLERELARVERLLEAKISGIEERIPSVLEEKLTALESHKFAQEIEEQIAAAHEKGARALAEFTDDDGQSRVVISSDGESGWLGVSVDEVTAEKAKELKLPSERGVLVNEVDADSPAAKAGLKKGDVITEFGGQRVEGVTQFRRYVRETPAGRAVQLTVWRDGRAQQISATLGDWGDYWRDRADHLRDRITTVIPRDLGRDFGRNFGRGFTLNMPDVQVFSAMGRPMLGIRTEDLDGQLGAYFGAPENEGVLVTHVNTGSPAEKAGMKAGDVIVKVDGGRVRDTGDLRERMRDAREKKTVPVAVIRKGAETTLNVEIEQPKPVERPRVTRRINL